MDSSAMVGALDNNRLNWMPLQNLSLLKLLNEDTPLRRLHRSPHRMENSLTEVTCRDGKPKNSLTALLTSLLHLTTRRGWDA